MSPLIGKRVVCHWNDKHGGVVLAAAYEPSHGEFMLLVEDDLGQLTTDRAGIFRVVHEPPPGVEPPSDGVPYEVPFG